MFYGLYSSSHLPQSTGRWGMGFKISSSSGFWSCFLLKERNHPPSPVPYGKLSPANFSNVSPYHGTAFVTNCSSTSPFSSTDCRWISGLPWTSLGCRETALPRSVPQAAEESEAPGAPPSSWSWCQQSWHNFSHSFSHILSPLFSGQFHQCNSGFSS